jgi:hypothetical protein
VHLWLELSSLRFYRANGNPSARNNLAKLQSS